MQGFEQFLEAAKVSYPHLSFSLADKEIFQQAIGRSQSQVKITPLVFEDADGSAFVDGSGGLQFISEYLASTNRSMFSRVAGRDNGTLIGVFAAGGGTGAGAVLGALSTYKRTHNGFTAGRCHSSRPARDRGTSAGGTLPCPLSQQRPGRATGHDSDVQQ